ncbi:peroxidase P7-like [Zingiber officinale]|uniref:peroxidase n=1 Tax=Zingiber officinale TaxID=94328 RepID=A0A8J5FF16_ZINOF|nr:peroxidase P7-like [Zingiber officinale]KAG6486541.1 hypothetical protein ZIOFF_055117 [Zingiber officinale]
MAISFNFFLLLLLLAGSTTAFPNFFLSPSFYSNTCPQLHGIVRSAMKEAIRNDTTIGAGLLRLFFHDCFAGGCDASVLLDDTRASVGEKTAPANKNSLRGFEVIDLIKKRVEAACPQTVSCADILALAARDSVGLLHGPRWNVRLGRSDATAAEQNAASFSLPGPGSSLPILLTMFAAKGLDARDMVALSGAHTLGRSHCSLYRERIHGDSNIDPAFSAALRSTCPLGSGNATVTAPFDRTPGRFDNMYFKDLVAFRGLLKSDQALYGGSLVDPLVEIYSEDNAAFGRDFAAAMVKLGDLSPLFGLPGEIRLNCRKVNA